MKNNKKCKLFVSSLMLGIALSTIGIVTCASSNSTSSYGYYTCNGYSYYNYNTIFTGTTNYGDMYASGTTVAVSQSGTPPAGWIGVQPRLYNSNGTLISFKDWSYSPTSSVGYGTSADYNPTSSTQSFYCKGSTKAWNGSDYYTYSTFPTPNLNDYT